jgi:hypothetical protein
MLIKSEVGSQKSKMRNHRNELNKNILIYIINIKTCTK